MGSKLILANFLLFVLVVEGVPETCLLPKDSGAEGKHCNSKATAYYFNRKTYACHKFLFTGCGGNENRFESRDACETSCVLTDEDKAKRDAHHKPPKSARPDRNPLLQTPSAEAVVTPAAPSAPQTTPGAPPPETTEFEEAPAGKSLGRKRRPRGKSAGGRRGRGKRRHVGKSRGRSRRRYHGGRSSRRGRGRYHHHGKSRRGARRHRGKGARRRVEEDDEEVEDGVEEEVEDGVTEEGATQEATSTEAVVADGVTTVAS